MTTPTPRPHAFVFRVFMRSLAVALGLVLGMAVAAALGFGQSARADVIETKTRVVTWVIPGSTGAVTFPQYLPDHPSAAVGGACQVDTYNVSTPEQARALDAVLYDGVLDGAHEDGALYLSHVIHLPGAGDCPALPTEEPTSTPTPTSSALPSASSEQPQPTPSASPSTPPSASPTPSVSASPEPSPTTSASPSPTTTAAPVASPTPVTPPPSAASSGSTPVTSSGLGSPTAPPASPSALPDRLAATGTDDDAALFYGLGGLTLILAGAGAVVVARRAVTR